MVGEPDLDLLIARLYSAALDQGPWEPLLDYATEVFNGVGTSFEVFDKKSGNPVFIKLGSGLQHIDASEYLEHYCRISPRVHFAEAVVSGDVTFDYAILSEAEIDADEFYSDYMKRLGMRYFLASHVLDANGHLCAFAVQRSARQGHVGDKEIDLMQRLVPHLQQAVDLKYRLAGANMRGAGFLECLEEVGEAVFLVGKNGEVLHANRAADAVLASADGILVEDGRIAFVDDSAKLALDRRLAGVAAGGDSFAVSRTNGARPYLVSVRRLPPEQNEALTTKNERVTAFVFIRDTGTFDRLNTELLATSYGLSVAESQMAVALDQGHTMKEIAKQRGVSPTTIRSQVYALMAKLSVSRQVDLVKILSHYRRPFV